MKIYILDFSRTSGQISTKLGTEHPYGREILIVKKKAKKLKSLKKGVFIFLYHLKNKTCQYFQQSFVKTNFIE